MRLHGSSRINTTNTRTCNRNHLIFSVIKSRIVGLLYIARAVIIPTVRILHLATRIKKTIGDAC